MLTINNNIIYYSYVICGFSDIDVKELSIFWNSKKVLESSNYKSDDVIICNLIYN